VDWNIRRWVTQRALGDASEETTWEARALQDPTLEPLLALIDPMLRRDPADRPTPQQLLRQLGPVWAARLDALEILTPEAPPMAADLFARLYRELRSNPTALAGLVTHGMMAIWGVLAPVLIDLPRHTLNTVATVTRAVSRGTLRGTKSVFRGTKKVFGWTTKALKMV
jgi:hypothetical protein